MGEPFVIFRCRPGTETGACALTREVDDGLQEALASAREFLISHALWQDPPGATVVVVGAPVAAAQTAWDLSEIAGSAFHGRAGLLLGDTQQYDPDVVTHELVHLWLRQAGAREPRWRLVERRGKSAKADGEAALIQEGLADFVAAARRGSPIIGVTTARPSSLRAAARCPEDLVGDEYVDSQVLSSALWRTSEVVSARVMLKAVASAAPRAAGDLGRLTTALETALQRESLVAAATWRQVADENGLRRCRSPIPVTLGQRTSSRGEHFVLPGRSRFPGASRQVRAPQSFDVAVPSGARMIGVTVRLTKKLSRVTVRWVSRPGTRHGEVMLDGWPVASASLPLPAGATGVTFELAHGDDKDLGYSDITVTASAGSGSAAPRTMTTASLIPTPGRDRPEFATASLGADAYFLPFTLVWAIARRWRVQRRPW